MKNLKILLFTVCVVSFFGNCMGMTDGKGEVKGAESSDVVSDGARTENQTKSPTKNLYTGIRTGSGKAVQRALAQDATVNPDDFDSELAASETLSPMGLAMLRLFEEPDNFVARFIIIQHLGEHPAFDHEHLEKMITGDQKLPNSGNNNRALAYLHRALEWGNCVTTFGNDSTSMAKRFAVAKFLLKHDPEAEVTDEHGFTAAQFCVEFGLEHAIAFLIAHEIDMCATTEDSDTDTPYNLAKQKLVYYIGKKDADKIELYTRIIEMIEESLEAQEEDAVEEELPPTRRMTRSVRSAPSDASGACSCLCAILQVVCMRHPCVLRVLDCCCRPRN